MRPVPLVTIGVPAYNSVQFVRETIGSLLRQDYPNFVIQVHDDGSTDGTAAVLAELASSDERIRFAAGDHHGERHSFNSVLSRAEGEYFMWAADHDLWDPSYVSACVAALERDPSAVLAYTHSRMVGPDGDDRGPEEDDELDLGHPRAVDRYVALIWRLSICNAIYGVMRREAVSRTGGYAPTLGPDHVVLAKMALQGTFIQLAEVMFYRRQNRPPEAAEEQRQRQAHDLDPATAHSWLSERRDAYYRPLRDEHLQAVRASGMSVRDSTRATIATYWCFATRFGVASRGMATVIAVADRLPAPLTSGLRPGRTDVG